MWVLRKKTEYVLFNHRHLRGCNAENVLDRTDHLPQSAQADSKRAASLPVPRSPVQKGSHAGRRRRSLVSEELCEGLITWPPVGKQNHHKTFVCGSGSFVPAARRRFRLCL